MPDKFDAYHQWLGIPPAEQPPNAYRLLGLRPFESDREVIENAADRQTLHLRTFQLGRYSDLSERLLNEVAAARLTLLDAARKAEYDRRLTAELHPPRPAPAATSPPSSAPAVLAIPRAPAPGPRRLAPVSRRPARRLPRWLVPAAAAVVLLGMTLALLVYTIGSVLTGGAPLPNPTHPPAVSPVQPPAEETPSPSTPSAPTPPIIIDSPHHRSPGPGQPK